MIVYITSAANTIKKGEGEGLQPESGVFRKWLEFAWTFPALSVRFPDLIHGVLFMLDALYTRPMGLCLGLRRILLKIHD
ncbi:hypothetical protein C6H66_00760 [Photorhabdus hindustanensis]|uniref:Uncharacterized protein n=1 Tax=Photorhabdus hindustanensis TaxID=2918802 RepID=A0A2S8Q9Y0_9GAMM|nr:MULTISPECIES: hypothetical protein [Photorhabdus]PQQ27349.1 hypothetical protein C6H69_20480 [Photorhabdus luminescens]PQQ30065.1 hypothetical protein C6H66_00760 [Photorhabdus hindustanensis]MBS9428498.1 hypothetical protein [Photorhabdus akhurstii]PQQ31627.1 hypothetical protein C6H64_05145 [Photorhabdus luminescens]PQQ42706.1 hypothetical protein C6H65_01530 [Photorhabdus luminescens]